MSREGSTRGSLYESNRGSTCSPPPNRRSSTRGSYFDAVPPYAHCRTNSTHGQSERSNIQSEGSRLLDGRTKKEQLYIIVVVLTAAMTASTLGYDVGVIAGAMDGMQDSFNLSNFAVEIVVGSLNVVAAFGALSAGYIADTLGRKWALGICCALYAVGTAAMALAPIFEVLLAGRITVGVGVGLAFVIGPTYISEITPPDVRGKLATVFDVSINAGIMMGYVVSYIIQNTVPDHPSSLRWRLMLGVGAITPLVVSVMLLRLPESPRWLVMKGRVEEAEVVLTKVLGTDADEVVGESIEQIERSNFDEAHGATWLEVLNPKDPHMKHIVGIAYGVGFWQQITGSEAVLYYSGKFLDNAGLKSDNLKLLGNMLVGAAKLLPEFCVMLTVDRFGRKNHMVLSAILMTVALSCLGLSFGLDLPSWTVVVFLCCFMASFSVGAGPFPFVVASEILPLRYRAKGMSINTFINRGVSGAVSLTALSFSEATGYFVYFMIFAGISLVSIPFFMKVPETCGKSLEEIQDELAEGKGKSVVQGFCIC
ncbi:putative polyol transporter 4 [Diplonema papillatum]|nr:putative polyol transporter 4 [Diplonema papillatum]